MTIEQAYAHVTRIDALGMAATGMDKFTRGAIIDACLAGIERVNVADPPHDKYPQTLEGWDAAARAQKRCIEEARDETIWDEWRRRERERAEENGSFD